MGWMSFPSRNLKPPRIITSWQLPSHTLSLSCVDFSSLPRSSDAEGCQRQCTQGLPPRGRAANQPPARAHCQVLWRLRGGRPTHNGLRVHEARGPQQIPQVRETPGARWEVGSIWAGGEDRKFPGMTKGPLDLSLEPPILVTTPTPAAEKEPKSTALLFSWTNKSY